MRVQMNNNAQASHMSIKRQLTVIQVLVHFVHLNPVLQQDAGYLMMVPSRRQVQDCLSGTSRIVHSSTSEQLRNKIIDRTKMNIHWIEPWQKLTNQWAEPR